MSRHRMDYVYDGKCRRIKSIEQGICLGKYSPRGVRLELLPERNGRSAMPKLDSIGITWHYTLGLRGRALLKLLCSSIERHMNLKLTAVGPHGRDVELSPRLIEHKLKEPDGELRLKGRRGPRTFLNAYVEFDAKRYDITGFNRSMADVVFQQRPRKAGDATAGYAAIRNIFTDLCESDYLTHASADSKCIYGHGRHEELRIAWLQMHSNNDKNHPVARLTYFSNAYLKARGQDEDLLTKAGLTVFRRLSHGVLTQTDETPLLDPDAYIDRLITIAKALRNPDYKPSRTFGPAGSDAVVLVTKRTQ